MSKRLALVALTALALAAAPPQAEAAVINGKFTFSFSNGGPINPFSGSFDINFDTATNVTTDTTTGLSNVVLPFALSSGTSAYNYFASAFGWTDLLVVGGTEKGVTLIDGNTNDYFVAIQNVSTNPTLVQGAYHTAALGFGANVVTGEVTFTPASTAIPEPTSLALLGLGILGLAAARGRSRTLAASAR